VRRRESDSDDPYRDGHVWSPETTSETEPEKEASE
jgi:hypothetical protein